MSPGDGIAARLAVVQSRTVTTRHGARRAVCSGLVLWFGRAPRMGLVAFSVALIPLILVDARAGAERQSRGEGRIAFTRGESGAPRPAQLAVIDADGKNRRVLPPFDVLGLSLSPDGRFIAFKPYSPMAGCSCAPGDLMTITVDVACGTGASCTTTAWGAASPGRRTVGRSLSHSVAAASG